jgi:UrcA family protein
MKSKTFLPSWNASTKPFVAMLLCTAVAGLVTPLRAQSSDSNRPEQVIVEASPFTIQRTPSRRQYRLVRPERVSISLPVDYADLTLSKPADAAEFERRIREAAKEVCQELDRRVPRSHFDIVLDPDCLKQTTEKALVMARRAIAGFG